MYTRVITILKLKHKVFSFLNTYFLIYIKNYVLHYHRSYQCLHLQRFFFLYQINTLTNRVVFCFMELYTCDTIVTFSKRKFMGLVCCALIPV